MTTANTTSAREGSMSHVTVFVAVAKPGSTRVHLAALGAWKSGDHVSLCTAARVGLELDVAATDARRVRYARGANCTKCLERSKSIQRSEFRYRDEETQAMATDEARARWSAESRAYSAAKDAADKDLERFLDLAESLDATPRQDARAEDERSRDEWVAMAKATMSPVPELTDEPELSPETELSWLVGTREQAVVVDDQGNLEQPEDDYATPEHPSVFARETFPLDRASGSAPVDEADCGCPVWAGEPINHETGCTRPEPVQAALDTPQNLAGVFQDQADRDAARIARRKGFSATAEQRLAGYLREAQANAARPIGVEPAQPAPETFYRAEAMPASREPYATDELGAPFIPGRSRVEHESDRGNYGLCTRSEQAGVWVTWDDTPGDRDWQYAAGELRLVKRF